MKSKPLSIEVDDLSKSYVITHNARRQPRTLRELLTSPFKRPVIEAEMAEESKKETFWALKDVSFNIGEGERIAIIGGNGAGKSTLLKILSRITEPTKGKVTIRGRVSSLLEVGTGFHPELTGRENIFLNGSILGMRRSEVAAKFDQIVDFSGVEKFIDTPVKHYSSGMYVRLAFSVSAWLDPDILIVDEVLSVGDQAFQRKCAERMKELTGAGRTVLFVSHSMAAVKSMCEKALYLQHGEVRSFGSVEEAASKYLQSIDSSSGDVWHKGKFDPLVDHVTQYGFDDSFVQCISAYACDEHNTVRSSFSIGERVRLVLKYRISQESPSNIVPNFHVSDEFGSPVFVSYPEEFSPNEIGLYTVQCNIYPFLLNAGKYSVMLVMSSFYGGLEYRHHFSYEAALRIEITEEGSVDKRRHGWAGIIPGAVRPRLEWHYSQELASETET
ncbi:ABC transporter ATP-binding protein [Thalassospira profundimaris]|uniref:ABC transporter ATP-binding protein n=1 Tax=Thalassospira profundimaris TaxID=502049 RepID=UPI0002872231|nr:ABC transporter ATP-binding protein [Thalassospira profundimaris]EKF09227.1 ABC transporter-like protein [Thalassospira profundimaris WP0211]